MFGFRKNTQKEATDFQQSTLQHIDSLYSTALRLCNNEKDAEDLVQDTYVKSLRFRDKFQEGTNLKAWLFKILTNTFINKYRRKMRERRFLDESGDIFANTDETSLKANDRFDPEREYISKVLAEDLQKAIEDLPADFKMAVILADIEEFSYKEIADMMDCPIGTVMSRIFRGRKLLQKQLIDQARLCGILPWEEKPAVARTQDEAINLSEFRQKRKLG
jgi:RNA polymerase sigma-70 factor (ECF subfamily)